MDETALATSVDIDENNAGTVHVRLVGQIDMQTVDAMAAAIADAAAGGPTEIVLDLSKVDFIDSSGLRQIVMATSGLEASGCRLCVDGLSGAAQRLLEVTGLIDRLRR